MIKIKNNARYIRCEISVCNKNHLKIIQPIKGEHISYHRYLKKEVYGMSDSSRRRSDKFYLDTFYIGSVNFLDADKK